MSAVRRMNLHTGLFLIWYFGVGGLLNWKQLKPISPAGMVFLISIILWGISLQIRIFDYHVKHLLLTMVGYMLAMIVLRTIRYSDFRNVYSGTDTVRRYLWYLYFIPVTVIPLLSFQASCRFGRRTDEPLPRRIPALWIPCVLLCLGVLTNDLHRQLFAFPMGIEAAEANYVRGILWILIWFWNFSLFLLSMVGILLKSRVTFRGREMFLILLAPLLVGSYIVVYPMGITSPERRLVFYFPEIYCFLYLASWELCIRLGLLPSNVGYREYFRRSHLAAQIVGRNGQSVMSASGAGARNRTVQEDRAGGHDPFSSVRVRSNGIRQREKVPGHGMLPGSLRLRHQPIHGGTMFWTEDISRLTELNQKLQQMGEKLAYEAEILQEETELQEEQASLAEQNRIYGEIRQIVQPQILRVDRLLKEAEKDPEHFEQIMTQVCFLAVYIKRRANLTLRAGQNAGLSSGDLMISIRESLDYLGRTGVHTLICGEPEIFFPSELILSAFDAYEQTVEAAQPGLTGLIVRLDASEDGLELRMTEENPSSVPEWGDAEPTAVPERKNVEPTAVPERGTVEPTAVPEWKPENLQSRREQEDDTVYLTLYFRNTRTSDPQKTKGEKNSGHSEGTGGGRE